MELCEAPANFFMALRKLHADLQPDLSEARNRAVYGAKRELTAVDLRREFEQLREMKENLLGSTPSAPPSVEKPPPTVLTAPDGQRYSINDVMSLENEVVALRRALTRLQSVEKPRGDFVTRADYDAKVSEVATLKFEKEALAQDRDEVLQSLQAAKFMNQQLDEKRREVGAMEEKLNDRILTLNRELEGRASAAESQTTTATHLGAQLKELQKRYDALAFSTRELGEQKTSLIDGLREKQVELELALSKLQVHEETLKRKNAAIGQMQRLLASTPDLNRKIDHLKSELDVARKTIEDLRNQVEEQKATTVRSPRVQSARLPFRKESLKPKAVEPVDSSKETWIAEQAAQIKTLTAELAATKQTAGETADAYEDLLVKHETLIAEVKTRLSELDFDSIERELEESRRRASAVGEEGTRLLRASTSLQREREHLGGELKRT